MRKFFAFRGNRREEGGAMRKEEGGVPISSAGSRAVAIDARLNRASGSEVESRGKSAERPVWFCGRGTFGRERPGQRRLVIAKNFEAASADLITWLEAVGFFCLEERSNFQTIVA
uniref:Uncharacterized protein n=1 Tax=Chrysotila carterae TaxID=13221 RepID=A0A7S4EUB3_CHRCT